jgi:basic membrane protein A
MNCRRLSIVVPAATRRLHKTARRLMIAGQGARLAPSDQWVGAAMMRSGRLAILTGLALIGLTATAPAQEAFTPGLIFDMGGKFDKSFNEAAYVGAERFKKETGIAYREFEVTNEGQREQALANMARRGVTIVAAVGFSQRSPVETVAKQFPNVKFTIVDAVVDLPNVQSIVYREHEGSFLVGMLAAMKSKTGKIGFVGGMDIPLIRKFALGYEEGAHFADPKVEVLQNMTGSTPAAWADPTRGAELARSQFDRGVDVVFAAAGTTGLGVLQAAADAGKLSIGSDSNQNYLHPGSVLTSMLKRVDNAIYMAFKTAQSGTWKPGIQVIGLAEDGIGYAMDSNNAALVTPDMAARLEAAKADIISGKLKVTDYMAK